MKPAPIAKIARPKLSGIVKRDRLFHLLDQGKQKPVIWVTAQGGSGKTTLVASWLDSRKLPCLWYQVDEGDADLASFFYYMGMAAKHVAPRYKKSLPLLTPGYLLGIPVFTRRYFEELFRRLNPPCPPFSKGGKKKSSGLEVRSPPPFEKGGQGGFVVVLDNYQDAPLASGFHDMIAHGLDTIPEGITVIVQSRAAPPPQLVRLQVNSRLHTIGWNDVRFTREESSVLLETQGHGKPSAEKLELLHNKTEGWAAGLLLMASGADTAAPEGLRSDKLFDYFASEAFNKADAPIQEILLKTSYLQRIDPALAEQLSGNAKAGQMLERMSRDHFFTQKYGQAYQYHPLFREFLQSRARATLSSADIVAVQRKAAELMEQSGSEEEAVGLYLAAADWINAERVALKQALALVAQGRSTVLEGWLNSFPNEHLEASPWALYWLGICRLAYNPAEARGHLEQAFLHFKKADDASGMFLSWASVIDTFVYEFSQFKPLDHWIAEADQLLAAHPEFPSPEIGARFAAGMLNALAWRQSHRVDVAVWAERVRQIAHHHPSAEMRISLGSSLIMTYQWIGDFAQARLLMDTLRPLSGLKEITPFTRLCWYAMEAGYYWAIADHATCMNAVTNGLSCAEESGIHLMDLFLLCNGVYSGLSLGDPQAAETCFQKMAAINSPRLLDKAGHQLMAFSVAWYHGDFKKAIVHGRLALKLYEQAGYPLMIAFMQLELAEALLDDGQIEEACSGLAQALASGRGINAIQWLYGLRGAQFAFARGEEKQGLDLLKQGMALAAQQGYVNMPRWNDRTMSRLCAKALEHNIETDYVRRLIRLRGLVPDTASRHLHNWPWEIRIHALGQFSVSVGDAPLRSTGKQQRKPLELLQLLVVAGERGLPVEQVVEALWPDMDGDKAYSACTSAVYRLRKLVGSEDAILTQEGRVTLNPQRCYVDAWAFEHLKERARRAANPEEAAPLLAHAIDAYRGAFLNDEQSGEWAMGYRERLHGKFLRAVLDTGRQFEERRDFERALACYQRGLERDDLIEALYQRILVCCRELGRRAEGLAAFERCRKRLHALLDISPSAQTVALRDLLMVG